MHLPRPRRRTPDPGAGQIDDAVDNPSDHTASTRRMRRLGLVVAVVLVGVAGATLGVILGGHTDHRVGPVTATFSVRPSLHGGSTITIPPLGSLSVRSHSGPAALAVRVDTLDAEDAKSLVAHPEQLRNLAATATDDVTAALERLLVQTAACALAGALVVGFVVFRSWRRSLAAGGVAVLLLVATGGTAALTRNPQALREPHYTGLLTNAPALVGSAEDFQRNFGVYSRELSTLVTTVSRLYATATTLPAYQPSKDTVRILHVSDLHLSPNGLDVIRSVIKQYKIQAVLDTGDLVDSGISAENRYAAQVGTFGVPYVYVRGNHDADTTVATVRNKSGTTVLNDTETTVAGIADPLFSPGQQADQGASAQDSTALRAAGQKLADTVPTFARAPDVLMVHDPAMAAPLAGAAPLVLAGHLHKRETTKLGDGTRLLVEGSTGGAGFRGLEHENPTPLECSVLYFDASTHQLRARDDITVGGLGQSKVTIDRTVAPAPGNATPSPKPTGSGRTGTPEVSRPGAPASGGR